MAVFLVTCGALAGLIASARSGDTVLLGTDCPALVDVRGRSAPGVTVDATGRTLSNGLRWWDNAGITWRGGTIHGGTQSYAADVRRGSSLTFDGVTFTDAKVGMVVNATKGIIVRRSTFTGLRSDGIDFTGAGDNGVAEGNVFRDFNPGKTTCVISASTTISTASSSPVVVPGQTLYGLSKAECTAKGGAWTDTYHPDAIQSWGGWGTLTARGNHIEGDTQGIDTFGSGPPRRFDISDNWLRISYSNGIVNFAAAGLVTRNYVDGYGRFSANLRVGPGVVACGNVVAQVPDNPANRPCPR